jgi:hypothetical protein
MLDLLNLFIAKAELISNFYIYINISTFIVNRA